LSDGSFHLFPYGLLVRAQFSPDKKKDCLTVLFDSHSIRISGTNLKKLALAFQRLSVEWIKEIDGNSASLQSADNGYINSIHIAADTPTNTAEED